MKYIICSIGHTAAGKTTTLRKIADKCGIDFISEGLIKRNLVGESFDVHNSMDEDLRSSGYKKAIGMAFDLLEKKDAVILDASFHQRFRRLWVYDEIINRNLDCVVIWVYCYCDRIEEVAKRINLRANAKKITADIQARTMEVYYYTIKTFSEVKIIDFPKEISTAIIYNNTQDSFIQRIEFNDARCFSIVSQIGESIYG